MAKKRATRSTQSSGRSTSQDSADNPVATAATAVDQARQALHEAQDAYRQACDAAADKAARARQVTVGDILDGTLEFVRHHPAAGLLASSMLGYWIGRWRRH